ncbi:hypothetical protein [Micrococcus lylae]|uniref:Integral membrane protein n=1 Tax=Micrococcus lylae TaxID=1273 RepID=A0ABY2JYC5_9MICC|nr:hypothetical protein [Micrococcus lylae]TFH98538.1 hypothetical protein E4A49_08475 [Micrococcus lylae]
MSTQTDRMNHQDSPARRGRIARRSASGAPVSRALRDLVDSFADVRGREEDADWARRADGNLAVAQVTPAHRHRLLARAHSVAVEAQESLDELFGLPEDWAAEVQEEAAAEGTSLTDSSATSAADVFSVGFVLASVASVLALVLTLIADGLTTDLSLGLLLLPAVIGLGGVGVFWAWDRLQRRLASVVAFGVVLVLAGALIALTALVMLALGEILFAGISSFLWLAPAAVYAGLAWLAARALPDAAADQGATPQTDDEWAARLAYLLRSRADVPEHRVTEAVAEARAHTAESGTTLAEEFGSPASYAARIPRDRVHHARNRAAVLTVAMTLVVGMLFGVLVPSGDVSWVHWLVVAGTVVSAGFAWADARSAARDARQARAAGASARTTTGTADTAEGDTR